MSRIPVWVSLLVLAGSVALGALAVWERAAIITVGAEVRALEREEDRLEEQARALRMGISRSAGGRELERRLGRGGKEAWVREGAATQEAVERARRTGNAAGARAGR